MKTLFILLISLSMGSGTALAQRSKKEIPPLKERMFYGGSFGLQLGTITDIQVSPVVGMWVLPRLTLAAGPDYRFYKDPDSRTDIFGGSVYMQFYFLKDLNSVIPAGIHLGLFLHAENELLSLQSSFWKTTYTSDRFFINTLLAGGGISQPMGMKSFMNMMFLWALNESPYNIYGNPEIRISFLF